MSLPPRISVVLPTYQHLRYLPAAIADIVGQTRTDWELIVVDDGSTDGTAEWLATAALDSRVRWMRQDNAGPDQAINAGIRAARGEYLTWVSADNRSAPYFLAALGAALDADPQAGLAYSPYWAIDADGRLLGLKADNRLLLRELVTGTPRGMAGFLYRRALHDAVGLYDGYACDTRMWALLAERCRCVFVLEPTVSYRFHAERATLRAAGRVERERSGIGRDFLAAHRDRTPTAMLRELYPGLSTAPRFAADAAADAAQRFDRAGFPDMAFDLARDGIRAAPASGLLALLIAGVAAALRCRLDPVEALRPALDGNPALSDGVREAALLAIVGLGDLLAATGASAPTGLLDEGHPLRQLERGPAFSYAAWSAGIAAAPLPAF